MNELNQILQDQVSALAELCCRRFETAELDLDETAQPMIKALVTNGYARLSKVNLQFRLEKEVAKICPEKSLHHRALLNGLTGELQSRFNHLIRWETSSPPEQLDAKAANISSATNS